MTESDQPYVWTRRDDESTPAYEAFRIYLNLGGKRSLQSVAQELSKATQGLKRWSVEHEWVNRARAYDSYLMTAETDGHANELARVRSSHLAVSDKLLDHLSNRLDTFIERSQDPTSAWTNAFNACTKAQQAALALREDKAGQGVLEQILAKVQKLERDE
jgi:hypothetical protein